MPRQLATAAGILFFLGAVTGILVSAAMTGKIDASGPAMLASHLNALMGCFWLVCVALTWQWTELSAQGTAWLVRSTWIAAYANWLVTLVKALLKVHGIDFIGEAANDVIFGALTLTVVLPTLASSWLWMQGLRRGLANSRKGPGAA